LFFQRNDDAEKRMANDRMFRNESFSNVKVSLIIGWGERKEKLLVGDSFFMSSQTLLLVLETHNKYFWSCLLPFGFNGKREKEVNVWRYGLLSLSVISKQ
jgi:hypothetical protein